MTKYVALQNTPQMNDRKGFAREVRDWLRNLTSSRQPRDANEEHASYRKCPACGERDFRISDRQRSKPELYGSRTFCVKWLCLSCGARETEIIEESDRR